MSTSISLFSSNPAILLSSPVQAPRDDDGSNGMSIAFATHSKKLHQAVADEVLERGWNDGTPAQVCDKLAQAKDIVSRQLKQSAWEQEFSKLKLDTQTALGRSYLFGPREEQLRRHADLMHELNRLGEHIKAGPDKYVGDFAPFMPDKETCLAMYAPSPPADATTA